MSHYHGSCHCGKVRFEIEVASHRLTDCNCSICSKKGALNLRVAPEQFRLISGSDHVALYQFGTLVAKHYFCPTCGIHTFTRPRSAPEMYTANARCLAGFDATDPKWSIHTFDGQHWEDAIAAHK